MIENLMDLPAGVRYHVFGVERMTIAEITVIQKIVDAELDELGWTRTKLSEKSGVSLASVYSLMNLRPISRGTIVQIVSVLSARSMSIVFEITNSVGVPVGSSDHFKLTDNHGHEWELRPIRKGSDDDEVRDDE